MGVAYPNPLVCCIEVVSCDGFLGRMSILGDSCFLPRLVSLGTSFCGVRGEGGVTSLEEAARDNNHN